MQQQYYLGIDGGGSKTRGVLLNREGQVVASASAPASSIIGEPNPRSIHVLQTLVGALYRQAHCDQQAILHCGIGLNGVDFADEVAMQHASLATALTLSPLRVTLVNDGIGALWGVSAHPAALIIQHGTGFTAAYRTRFGDEHLFDHLNVGQCFDVRRAVLKVVARMIDGRTTPTSLKDAVLRYLGITTEESFAETIYREQVPPQALLRIVPVISAAWEVGDAAAIELLNDAAEDYLITVKAMITRTGSDNAHIAFGGGVLEHLPGAFLEQLAAKILHEYPRASVLRPLLPAEVGCAIMAGFAAGEDPVDFFTMTADYYSGRIADAQKAHRG
ncbi:MAG: N-acetylglucosamine kinase [Armatimonadota bacterium]